MAGPRYIMTEETRNKMRLAKLGRKLSEETKKKMSESRKGRITTEETRKKISESKKNDKCLEQVRQLGFSNRGKVRSEETRKKLRKTPEGYNKDKRHNLIELQWRKSVKDRDNWTCQICGVKSYDKVTKIKVELHAHHIKPVTEYPELQLEVANGITCCKKCHKDIHRVRRKFKGLLLY